MDAKGLLSRRPHALPALIAAVMLLGTLSRWPYDYYRVLRWVTCAAAVFVAYSGYAWKRYWATWLFGVVAVLFNPIAPIYLTRQIWRPIDVAVALAFLVSIAVLAKPVAKGATDEAASDD